MECVDPDIIRRLSENPSKNIFAGSHLHKFNANIVIPNIAAEIQRHFFESPDMAAEIAEMQFRQFGLFIDFDAEQNFEAFDDALFLHPQLKQAISVFGVCIFRNVKLLHPSEKKLQKNIFPDLQFHVDRGANFSNQYSLFYRDPSDPDHWPPRNTSTLVMPNSAFHLQSTKQGMSTGAGAKNRVLFTANSIRSIIGKFVLEQRWDASEKTGEICVFDNRTVLHASHHRGARGYPI